MVYATYMVCTSRGAHHDFGCTPPFLVCTSRGAYRFLWCTPRILVYTNSGTHHGFHHHLDRVLPKLCSRFGWHKGTLDHVMKFHKPTARGMDLEELGTS